MQKNLQTSSKTEGRPRVFHFREHFSTIQEKRLFSITSEIQQSTYKSCTLCGLKKYWKTTRNFFNIYFCVKHFIINLSFT